jgi:hypothetical protein
VILFFPFSVCRAKDRHRPPAKTRVRGLGRVIPPE